MGFYWLLGLILYHPAGCGRLFALYLYACVSLFYHGINFKCKEPATVKCLVMGKLHLPVVYSWILNMFGELYDRCLNLFYDNGGSGDQQ